VTPILLLIDAAMKFNVNMDFENPPTFMEMLPHFIVFQIMEDIMFFVSHRLLHTPTLYRFHKVHHEYTTSVSIAGLHSHVVEFLISNTVTLAIYMHMAESMFGIIHMNTRIIWTLLRMWDAYNGHCGYMFSWAPLQLLPFCASEDYHDFHHSSNSGNYAGQFRLLDSFLGYNEDFWQHRYKRKLEDAKKAV
jgi:plant 4alpha-monomethylsterol monooxygenase